MMVKPAVVTAIEDVRTTFASSGLVILEDGQGGAHVIVETTALGGPYLQEDTWIGGHIAALFPYADIYPIFVRGDLARKDGKALQAPVTSGHVYQGRSAVQVSRRSNARDPLREKASMKLLKVISYLESQ